MKQLVLSIVFVLAASMATAQEDNTYFLSVQECGTLTSVLKYFLETEQSPLFSTDLVQYDAQGNEYWGAGMLFVNQDSGLWTLATLYADGTICITAGGVGFEPYSG